MPGTPRVAQGYTSLFIHTLLAPTSLCLHLLFPSKQATLHFSTSFKSVHVAMVAGSYLLFEAHLFHWKPCLSLHLHGLQMGREWFSVLMNIYFLQLLSCPLDGGNHSLPLYLLSIYITLETVLDAINL